MQTPCSSFNVHVYLQFHSLGLIYTLYLKTPVGRHLKMAFCHTVCKKVKKITCHTVI